MTYDILSAVAEELSFGRSLEEALAVLNVTNPEDQKFKIVVCGTCDGVPVHETVDTYEPVDLVRTDESADEHSYFVHAGVDSPDRGENDCVGRVVITPESVGKAEYDHAANRFRIPAETLKFLATKEGKRRYVLEGVLLYPVDSSVWGSNRRLALDPKAL